MAFIEVILKSDLCAGNGESSGNRIDNDICIDSYGLPYIPARRLKGCLRQAAVDLGKMGDPLAEGRIPKIFGTAHDARGKFFISDAIIPEADGMHAWLEQIQNLNNRDVPESLRQAAHPQNVIKLFTGIRGQTAMEDGVKVDNTLRFTRVLNHYDICKRNKTETRFKAEINLDELNEEEIYFLDHCCKTVRHIGTHRNRGLGNVRLILCFEKEEAQHSDDKKNGSLYKKQCAVDSRCRILYQICLDSPVTIPGGKDVCSEIPASSVVGCMADAYLKNGQAAGEEFRKLFLDGTVIWSSLTPVIEGVRSMAVPSFIMRLKNAGSRYINTLAESDSSWKKQKPKNLEGGYYITNSDKIVVANPGKHTFYHNSIAGQTLYMQDSLDADQIYGGYISCPAEYKETIIHILKTANLRFGRSKTAQYAKCSLCGSILVEDEKKDRIKIGINERVYVVLCSDLLIDSVGLNQNDNRAVRVLLSEKIGIQGLEEDSGADACSYKLISGFNTQWKLQKYHYLALSAGSFFCFTSCGEAEIDREIKVGSMQQEGFGLCRIMTESELKQMKSVFKGEVQRKQREPDPSGIEAALLEYAGEEAIRKRVNKKEFLSGKENVPVGRLRLMLEESNIYPDLLKRVMNMKTSDMDGTSRGGKRNDSLELVQSIYGERELNLEKMLSADPELWGYIQMCPEALERLENHWKMALSTVLHALHYGKEHS